MRKTFHHQTHSLFPISGHQQEDENQEAEDEAARSGRIIIASKRKKQTITNYKMLKFHGCVIRATTYFSKQ